MEIPRYTSRLGAGLGLVQETKILFGLWTPGMSSAQLLRTALESGQFPLVTARRLRNIVTECFSPRYLIGERPPIEYLKRLDCLVPSSDLVSLMLLYTSRANPILGDFIRQVYWPWYSGGHSELSNLEARAFVQRAIDDGKTTKRWSESMTQNVAGYLTGCCADYGLLERGSKTVRKILSSRISSKTVTFLAYDLHFSGIGDNALLTHEDFLLYGMERIDVLDELKRLSLQGHLMIQSAGDVVRVGWKYPPMEALCDVLA